MFEDSGRREHAHKHSLDPKRSNFQIKTFYFNEKETSKGPVRRERAHKYALNPKDNNFESNTKTFESKTTLEVRDQIR